MNKAIISLLLVATLGVLLWMQKQNEPLSSAESELTVPDNIDFYLTQSQQKSFKDDGSLHYTLNSQVLKHYQREDVSNMQQPNVFIQHNNLWEINALTGLFQHTQDIMTFSDDVILSKKASDNHFDVSSKTLLLNIKQDLAISESNVKVKGKGWHIHAQDMTIDMSSDIHQFTSVKAQYRNDSAS